MPDRTGVAAILLAAGQSRRMGAINKLLLEIDGQPMVRRAARTLLASRVEEVVAVLGHQADAVAEALSGLPLRMVHNAGYRQGQMTSVRTGLNALPDRYRGILIGLADQPALTAADIDVVAEAFLSGEGWQILVPVQDGRRGNPIVLSADLRADLADRDLNFGCRNLIARHPDLVQAVDVPGGHYFADIDTPGDLAGMYRI